MGLLDGMFSDRLSLDKLMSNPAFQAGLGILSANGSVPSYGKAGPIIGQGLSSGLQNAQAYRQAQSQEQMQRMAMQQKQAEYEQKKSEQERSRQFAEQFRQQMMGGAPISGQGNLQGAGGVPAGPGPTPMGGGGYPYGMTAEQYQFAQQLPPEQLQGFVGSIVKTNTGAAKGELGMFDELRRRGEIPQGMTFTDWKRANAKSGASNTSVRVSNDLGPLAAKFFMENAAKKEGTDIGQQMAGIEGKYTAIDAITGARNMLDKGIYAGYWGGPRMAATKMSAGLIGDKEKVVNTERFRAYVGDIVIPRLQEFGGNDSVEELNYLRQVMAGDLQMEPESLGAILDSAETKIKRGIERLQRQRQSMESGTLPPLDKGPSREQSSQPGIDELLRKYGGQ